MKNYRERKLMKRKGLEKEYLFNIFIQQLVTEGLEIIERVDKLQCREHLGLFSHMK